MSAPSLVPFPTIHPLEIDAASEPKRSSRWSLVARRLADAWVMHLTLIVIAGLFAFPFVWMVGMSLKTDEEATDPGVFPEMPIFRAASPFVRRVLPPERPPLAGRERWARLAPKLLESMSERLAALPLPVGAFDSDGSALRFAAANQAVRLGVNRLNDNLWSADHGDDEILIQITAAVSDADLATSLSDCFGRVELGNLQIRSLSGRANASGPGPLWTVVSGDAHLISTPANTQVLQYHFADASAPAIVLRASSDGQTPIADFHRMIVSYKGDASWHRIDAELHIGDQRYISDQTTYVAQHRGASLLLQPPTFQDQTLGPRAWVPLKLIGTARDGLAPTQVILTLTLRPTSTLQAIGGKVQRNYQRAFRSMPFWTYVGNSVALVVLQVAGALFSSGFVAYAFARLNWPGRSMALGILLATMMLPAQVTMIPTFMIWRALGWYNTLNPLWIGAWLGNAFFIFLMIQSMRAIPLELDEASRIDGMNALQTWWYVIMPQVKPTLAAIAILTFMGAWNEFMGPLIMLRDQTKFPLGLGLIAMRTDAGTDWPLLMAGNLLMTLPVIVIFFLFQRYFIEGVTVTGMKG